MSSFEQHCRECEEKLGEPFEKVHQWMDAPVSGKPFGEHRRLRHNIDGINEVGRMWGSRASEAARIHVMADFGCVPTAEQSAGWTLDGGILVPEDGRTMLTDECLGK